MLDEINEFDSIPDKEQRNYFLIETEDEANKILDEIINNSGCIIGIDIEAAVEMSRFGILCLLQICYNSQVFIFDMTILAKKLEKLKTLFEDNTIVKVFHDCLEDCSLLLNYYKIDFKNIFDTQIAHRLCFEEICGTSNNTKHSAISLNDLLVEYLNIYNPIKYEIHIEMNKDPYYWKKRPLSQKMIEYASNDVIYLPQLYYIFCENNSFSKIQNECEKYLEYLKINLNIKNFNKINLEADRIIQGLLKNIQKNCMYVQLNIGYHGIITNKKSINKILNSYKIGDIIYVKIVKLDQDRKRYILDYADKSDYIEKGNNTPELIKIDLNKFIDKNNNFLKNLSANSQKLSHDEYSNKNNKNSISENESDSVMKNAINICTDFTRKLKLNPNAKPIHFSTKTKNSLNNIKDSQLQNDTLSDYNRKKTLNVNQTSFFPQSFTTKSQPNSTNKIPNNNPSSSAFSKSIYDDSFDSNSIYNINKNPVHNYNNTNPNNKSNVQGSKSFNNNNENFKYFNANNYSGNNEYFNKNYVINSNLFEENSNYLMGSNNFNSSFEENYFVKMKVKLNMNAEPYSEILTNHQVNQAPAHKQN